MWPSGVESLHTRRPLPTITTTGNPPSENKPNRNEDRVSERYSHTRVPDSAARNGQKLEAAQTSIGGDRTDTWGADTRREVVQPEEEGNH